jgi:hypothetical protein
MFEEFGSLISLLHYRCRKYARISLPFAQGCLLSVKCIQIQYVAQTNSNNASSTNANLNRPVNLRKISTFPGSSMVERSAVNRNVGSSNLPRGATSSHSCCWPPGIPEMNLTVQRNFQFWLKGLCDCTHGNSVPGLRAILSSRICAQPCRSGEALPRNHNIVFLSPLLWHHHAP